MIELLRSQENSACDALPLDKDLLSYILKVVVSVTRTAIARWGNSPALRLPKTVMEQANLHEGDPIEFEVQAPGVIIVRSAEADLTLEDLVSQIKPGTRPPLVDWGKPRGKEVW